MNGCKPFGNAVAKQTTIHSKDQAEETREFFLLTHSFAKYLIFCESKFNLRPIYYNLRTSWRNLIMAIPFFSKDWESLLAEELAISRARLSWFIESISDKDKTLREV